MNYKKIIAEKINTLININLAYIESLIEIPPRSDMGDFAFPCFQLSKTLKKSPNIIAAELKEKMDIKGFEKIETIGPYLNFFIDKAVFVKEVLKDILAEGDSYGSSKIGAGKNIVVEYSSPNIAKPFHVGHLFTTAIGNAIYKMLSFEGYSCIRINYLRDWGTQFGKLIAAYKMGWADEEKLEAYPIKELLRIYVKFHKEAEKHPEYETKARKYFKLLEDGADEEVKLWTKFRDLSLKEFSKIYKRLNVEFDSYDGESLYSNKMDAVVNALIGKDLLVESNGAEVVMLDEYNMPPCIIKKSDGTTTYAARNLASAVCRKNSYCFYKSIYVLETSKSLFFRQFVTTLKLMRNAWAEDCVHVGFGLVKFADKKLATRKGDAIFLNDLLDEAVEKILEIINLKNPNLENKEGTAEKIGIGAVIFAYLKNDREQGMFFDWNELLSFDGETGPYIQYSYVRGISALKKSGNIKGQIDFSKLKTSEEFELVKLLSNFKNNILCSIEKYEPCVMARYLIEVSKAFNKFYNIHSVLSVEDAELRKARIKLVEASCQVLKNGLDLLGIEVVEQM